ncbi:DNA primase [Weissella oryzae SG25]|uniref:DNA primase n=1 Tax=Weissella oryzae (strain DSM 25784 / JCM 18191 / LMG 30913 / SG25) TaxID=1329250 RepID=A0A069CTD3_WEIOS|nr:DNA primase [Weissella oryzae]GAK31075.1 DNA primase [Weissella oryzae SG25]
MASRIPAELVDEIRQKVNIVDVITPYVQLRKRGGNLFGFCPWHEERTGSFTVNEEKQIFHCFSCGRGGNVFNFVMEMENLSFPQAVAKVAPIAGLNVDDSMVNNDSAEQVSNEVRELRELYAEATKLYHHLLVNTTAGEAALDYLHGRGLDDGTIDAFMLGFAPEGNVLLDFFTEQGKDYQLLRRSELFVERDDGSLVDRFSNRVLFTIRDRNGHPIAYSGRKLTQNDDQPKYINSPESPLFNKSRELFNFDLARNAIRQNKEVILLEGYMDVIAAFQAGITNAVASMGTSLTLDQVQIIARQSEKIFISYDADHAGQAATKRALDMIQNDGRMQPLIVHIPGTQDPDEFFRSEGAEAFKQLLQKNIETPIAFGLRYLRDGRDLSNSQEQLNYVNDAVKLIAKEREPVVRDRFLRQLADEFSISLTALNEQVRPLLMQVAASRPIGRTKKQSLSTEYSENNSKSFTSSEMSFSATPKERISGIEMAQSILLAWMLKEHEVWLQVTANPNFHFSDANYETLVMLASAYKAEHPSSVIDLASFMDFVKRPELTRILASFEGIEDALFEDRSKVADYIEVIMNKMPLSDKIRTLRREYLEAKQTGDSARIRQKGAELMSALKEKEASRYE